MGIEPKDLILLFVGWLITKMLDYMVKSIAKTVQKKNTQKRTKRKKGKRRK